jgi:hypothetical protein
MGDEIPEFKEMFVVALAFSTLVAPKRRYTPTCTHSAEKKNYSDHLHTHL